MPEVGFEPTRSVMVIGFYPEPRGILGTPYPTWYGVSPSCLVQMVGGEGLEPSSLFTDNGF